jgi:DNA helicase-2/ATP-dependent DNA helicase PcrA
VSAPLDLNPAQLEAVNHRDGPLLVLAGPGSGKTRVITRRVARLVESGVWASRILAITFTNKAASEMQTRVERLLPGNRVWVSTFHRLCARLLRRFAPAVGLEPNFSILDTSDQTHLMRDVLTGLDVDTKHFTPGKLLYRIGQAKQKLQSAEQFAREVADGRGSYLDTIVSQVYTGYEKALLRSNAVDFDDLLLHVCRLLSDHEEIRAELDERFRYILVDEYQDTNLAQYQIVRMLSHDFPNLCATGDPDQSIYGWRGAEIGNILRFEQDFPDARVVRLEQNYRSTQSILRAADSLIAHNVRRKHKTLFTDNPPGLPVEVLACEDQTGEAEEIAQLLRQLAGKEQRPWSDFAIFYRVNALSRGVEMALSRRGIPYQVAAGVAFYERAEVKDVVAYLRLVHNPADRAAFLRIVNTPVRGIGKQTIGKIAGWGDRHGISALEAARRASEFPGLSKRAVVALQRFAAIIDEFAAGAYGGVAGLIDVLLQRTGYGLEWKDSRAEGDMQRAANVEELKSAARQYDAEHPDDASLEGFLESASLVSDLDGMDENAGQVTLMTLHAAKGLEFPVVVIVAVEDRLLPHERSLRENNPNEIEEERRLLFVGITRAKERVYLTRTFTRDFRGNRFMSIPSRFLTEMPVVISNGSGGFDFGDESFASDGPRADVAAGDGKPAGEPAASTAVGAARNSRGESDSGSYVSERHGRQLPHSRPLLTTGADLLSGAARPIDIPQMFSVGMSVRHPRLGVGSVIEAQGLGKWRTVTVVFSSSGETQSFVAHKCPLQPVGLTGSRPCAKTGSNDEP